MRNSPQATRILLADDNPAVRQAVRALLERAGLAVVAEASNGQQALEMARAVCPDTAVLDLKMPVVNGFEAARRIAEICPGARFVAVTVHAEDHYVLAALEAGITGYVLKSRIADELVKAIDTVRQGKVHVAANLASGLVEAWLDAHSPR